MSPRTPRDFENDLLVKPKLVLTCWRFLDFDSSKSPFDFESHNSLIERIVDARIPIKRNYYYKLQFESKTNVTGKHIHNIREMFDFDP